MPRSLYSIVPNAEALLALEPEELAGIVLERFNSEPDKMFNRHNFGMETTVSHYPREHWDALLKALMEAWSWLEREGLIVPVPAAIQSEGWYALSRRGKQITSATELSAYRKAALLPKQLLHPIIAQKVWAPFLRGDYDTAVFQAFKEVEVAIRAAGKYGATTVGVELMRRAFGPGTGPLTDKAVPAAEQEALMHLFAGAIGSYKNPHSHRNVTITDPAEAVEMIMLASHLLKIVDSRAPPRQTTV